MNFKKSIFIISTFILLFSNLSISKENKILIKVDNEIITTIDILNEIKFISAINKEFVKINKNKKIEIAKNSLIKEKIKLIEVTKFKKNLKLDDNIFESIMKNYFVSFNFQNLQEFKDYFDDQNINTNFIRKKIIINTFWNKLIFEKFSKNVKIDKNKIEQSVMKEKLQTEYLLSEIVFAVNKKENLNKKKKLITKSILEKNFSEAALSFSISDTATKGGKLGWIKENILSENIKNELITTKVGEFTNPITIPGGFLILKIEDLRKIEKNLDFEKEVRSIIEKKTNDQLNRLSNIYLNKLEKNIQINEI